MTRSRGVRVALTSLAVAGLFAFGLPATATSVSSAQASGPWAGTALADSLPAHVVADLAGHPRAEARGLAAVVRQEPVTGLPPELILCGLFILGLVLIGAIPVDLQQIVGRLLLCLVAGAVPRTEQPASLAQRGQAPGGWVFYREVRGPTPVEVATP